MGVLCLSLFCYAILCVNSSFAIILKRKRCLVALLLLSYRCLVIVNVQWLFLTVPLVGLQFVIVVFPDHTHLLFVSDRTTNMHLSKIQNEIYGSSVTKCILIIFKCLQTLGLEG